MIQQLERDMVKFNEWLQNELAKRRLEKKLLFTARVMFTALEMKGKE
jgi:hypothetical protein